MIVVVGGHLPASVVVHEASWSGRVATDAAAQAASRSVAACKKTFMNQAVCLAKFFKLKRFLQKSLSFLQKYFRFFFKTSLTFLQKAFSFLKNT